MKLFLVISAGVLMMFGCEQESKLNKVKFNDFTFQTYSSISNKKSDSLIEGSKLSFNLEKMTVELSGEYYSNNLYEYDVEIVSKDDTARLRNLKENNVPFIAADRKSDVDLDYSRVYNVFFDTIQNIPIKVLKPRISFESDYKVFVAKIPNTYKNNIGYKSLTIVFKNVKKESDVHAFEQFYKSMVYSPNK